MPLSTSPACHQSRRQNVFFIFWFVPQGHALSQCMLGSFANSFARALLSAQTYKPTCLLCSVAHTLQVSVHRMCFELSVLHLCAVCLTAHLLLVTSHVDIFSYMLGSASGYCTMSVYVSVLRKLLCEGTFQCTDIRTYLFAMFCRTYSAGIAASQVL